MRREERLGGALPPIGELFDFLGIFPDLAKQFR